MLRVSIVLALTAALSATSAWAQVAIPIERALRDADSDGKPDCLDKPVTIAGVVTVDAFSAQRGKVSELRCYVEDASGAVRFAASGDGKEQMEDLARGTRVKITGVVREFRGMPWVKVLKLTRNGTTNKIPEPIETTLARDAAPPLLGKVVRVRGFLEPAGAAAAVHIHDAWGRMRLFMRSGYFQDPDVNNIVRDGGDVEVVGIMERRDTRRAVEPEYRLRLRSPRDLQRVASVTVTEEGGDRGLLVAAIIGGGLVVGLGLLLFMRRPHPSEPAVLEPVGQSSTAQLQAQKMESLGTLAGGIAHDFNNYLLAIMGFAELARDDASGEAVEHLDEVLATCERARQLSDKVLEFGRKSEPRLDPTDIGDAVRRGLGLLRAVLPSNVKLVEGINPFSGIVLADENQLHQVLLNLGSNACDAMRGAYGTLTVTLDRKTLDADEAKEVSTVLAIPPGDYAQLTVTDAGPGMSASVQSRIFEPFFTTKGVEGTGLGLSVVHGILARHHAGLRVTSEEGKGTSFQIYLRLSTSDTLSETGVSEVQDAPSGTERVLLVDDEVALVTLGARRLSTFGYDVQGFSDPVEALEAFRSEEFAIVVTDYAMPGLSGIELATSVHQHRPETPILMTTGFSSLLPEDGLEEARIAEVLPKPYRSAQLAAAVRRVLDERRGGEIASEARPAPPTGGEATEAAES